MAKQVIDETRLKYMIGVEREVLLGFDHKPSISRVMDRTREAVLNVVERGYRFSAYNLWDISQVEDTMHDMRREVLSSMKGAERGE